MSLPLFFFLVLPGYDGLTTIETETEDGPHSTLHERGHKSTSGRAVETAACLGGAPSRLWRDSHC